MSTVDMLSVIRNVPQDEFIYDKIIQTYIQPLYVTKKLSNIIYLRIRKEAERLHKMKKKKEEPEFKMARAATQIDGLQSAHRRRPLPPTPTHTPVHQSPDNKLYEKIAKLKDQKLDLEKKNESLKEETRNLRMRLSKIAGDTMKTNNPNIADLSDKYRPTELGKQFSELYDNEWSDAFEEVDRQTKDENKSVLVLYSTVKHAFDSCRQKAKVQEERIRKVLLDLEDSEHINTTIENLHNQLIEVRKSILDVSSKNVAKNYVQGEFAQMISASGIKQPGPKLQTFAVKCAELCWCMAMCDPPMDMNTGDINKPFDRNTYREYTRSVKDLKTPVVEFIVWPALFLNSGGNMVSKGVAQPCEKKPKK